MSTNVGNALKQPPTRTLSTAELSLVSGGIDITACTQAGAVIGMVFGALFSMRNATSTAEIAFAPFEMAISAVIGGVIGTGAGMLTGLAIFGAEETAENAGTIAYYAAKIAKFAAL